MASTSAISGLVSGLDTKTIISQLMSIAKAPQDELKTSLSRTSSQIAAAQSINSKAASMTSLAKDLAAAKTYTTASATSTDPAVSATASSTATSGSVTFVVAKTARAHSLITGPLALQNPANATGYTFQFTPPGASSAVSVSAASDSAADIAKALSESADAKVTATVVNDGTGQRLQITAEETGGTKTFTSDGLPTAGGAAADTLLEQASGAEIRITGATASQGFVSLSSDTNTFTGVMTGVDITVSKADELKPVTVSTSVNRSAITSKVGSLVTAMNNVLSDVAFHTKALATGVTASSTSGGLLRGNSTMRDLAGQVMSAVSAGTPGGDNATLAGLSVTRQGEVTFDASAFEKLYTKDPAKAAAVLQKFADAVQTAGKLASDSSSGSVTGFISGGQTTVKTLTDSIASWDDRLAAKQKRLEAQYNALEVALGKLSSQSDSLTAALKQLNGNND